MSTHILPADKSQIIQLLQDLWNYTGSADIHRLGGLTNHTYRVILESGDDLVFRLPGEGTEEMIRRNDEKISTQLASSLGIDTDILYFDETGVKIMRYIPDAITMSEDLLKDPVNIAHVADIFRQLHTCGIDTKVPFEVFDMAANYEKIIHELNVPMFEDYASIKHQVMSIKSNIDSIMEIQKVPCHNDPLCENWIIGQDRIYLIDWEYAGMNDGMWDIADVAIEANYSSEDELHLLCAYLNHAPNHRELQHYYANKIYVDYLWTLWAKARVPYDGQPMDDWACERYTRMKCSMKQFEELSQTEA